MELPQLPKRKVFYLILDKKRQSFLQSDGTEESFISTKQTGPSNLTRKKRAPPTPQSAKKTSCLTLLARERTELLTIFSSSSEDGRELTLQKKAWSSPDLQKESLVLPPPQPSKKRRGIHYFMLPFQWLGETFSSLPSQTVPGSSLHLFRRRCSGKLSIARKAPLLF